MLLTFYRIRFLVGLVLAVCGFIGLLLLESHFQTSALSGLYFQAWSSESILQTVSLLDLTQRPLESLWYLHIQPPLFDTLRMLLAFIFPSDNEHVLVSNVDQALYFCWAMIFGLMAWLVFWCLSENCHVLFALIATFFFMLHPAGILYASLLDSTYLTSFFILFYVFCLRSIYKGKPLHPVVLSLSFLLLFFTRSMFYWPWLIITFCALVLLQYPKKSIAVFMIISGIAVGAYTYKQHTLFNITTTSSFTGLSLTNSIGLPDGKHEYFDTQWPPFSASKNTPSVLTRYKKIGNSRNFNNLYLLDVNQRLIQKYHAERSTLSLNDMIHHILINCHIYFMPSSRYTNNIIVDHLPYRAVYDRFFSFPALPLLLFSATLIALTQLKKAHIQTALGLSLPIMCIMFICVFADRGENVRFKFFIEPVLFIFIAEQLYMVWLIRKSSGHKLAP